MTELVYVLVSACPALAAIVGIVIAALIITKRVATAITTITETISTLKDSEIQELKVSKEDLLQINNQLLNELKEERLLTKELLTKIDRIKRD